MPKLWDATIEQHRHAVREAALDAVAALVADTGARPLTMSKIAQAAGIGRATLYKYFPDLESVVLAWHEREVEKHLAELARLRDVPDPPGDRLLAVLGAYARIARSRGRRTIDEVTGLHDDEHVHGARRKLDDLLAGLIEEAGRAGSVRVDVPPDELAAFCVHALAAARGLTSEPAVRRLVEVTFDAVRHR